MTFSQRKGFIPISDAIQRDSMSSELRNGIWNFLQVFIWDRHEFFGDRYAPGEIQAYTKALWWHVLKKPIDTRPFVDIEKLKSVRKYYFECQWYEAYDYLEFTLRFFEKLDLYKWANQVLESENSGYRFVNGFLTDIISDDEIKAVDEATSTDMDAVRIHFRQALELYSNREQPDFRNSIKESISGVEAMVKAITKNPKATLGDALKLLPAEQIHPALRDAFQKLYGYTNDADGIRHALQETPVLVKSDAKFFLVICSAFVNYLKEKVSPD